MGWFVADFLSAGRAAPDGADRLDLHQPGRETEMVDRDQGTKGHVAHPARMHEPSLLLTDLDELSMLEAYAGHGMAETAVFELFVRKLPAGRGFLMAAGLEQVVDFLETMRFTPDELGWLGASGMSLQPSSKAWRTCASPVMSMRCRRALPSSPTNRCCVSSHRCLRGPTGRDPADQPHSFSNDHRL